MQQKQFTKRNCLSIYSSKYLHEEKEERSHINNLTFYLKGLEEGAQGEDKASMTKLSGFPVLSLLHIAIDLGQYDWCLQVQFPNTEREK